MVEVVEPNLNMNYIIFLIGIAAFLSTCTGGLVALRFKDKLHLILGFSAGAIIAVAFFELLPEAIKLANGTYDVNFVTSVVGLGFAIYLILDRFIIIHSHHDEQDESQDPRRGMLGASSLSLHSFLDGVAIGAAFQVSSAIGIIISTAVLVHDFSDGINTVNVVLKNGGTNRKALQWVAIDALTPILGIISTIFFSLSSTTLSLLLALFCGFFLYIGATDLLPESHHRHPKALTTIMTVVGLLVLYGVIAIAG